MIELIKLLLTNAPVVCTLACFFESYRFKRRFVFKYGIVPIPLRASDISGNRSKKMNRKVFLILILIISAIPLFSHTHYLDTAVTISNKIQIIESKIDFLSQIAVCYYKSGNESKADSLIANLSKYHNNSDEFIKALFETRKNSNAFELLQPIKDYQDKLMYLELFNIAINNNDFDIADKIKRKGRFKNETQDNSKSTAEIMLAKRYIELGKLAEAEIIIDSTSTPVPYSIGMRSELWVEIWIESAELYSQLDKKNKALKKCELAENTLNELLDKRFRHSSYYSKAENQYFFLDSFYDIFQIYYNLNENDKCFKVLNSIEKVLSNEFLTDDLNFQNHLLIDVIYSYSKINKYSKSDEIWHSLEFEDSKIMGLILIAKSYIGQNDEKNAKQYLKKCINRIVKMKESNEIFWPQTSYRKYEFLDETININGISNYKKSLNRIKDVIYSYSKINKYSKSDEIWHSLEFEDSKIMGLILIAKSYIGQNDEKNAKQYLKKCINRIVKMKESNEIFWSQTSYRKYEFLDEIINIKGISNYKKSLNRIKNEINKLNFDFHKSTSLLKLSLIYDEDSDTFSSLFTAANSSVNNIDDTSMKIYKNLEFATILSKNNQIQLADNYIKEAIELILGADKLNNKILNLSNVINTCIDVSPNRAIELIAADISVRSKIGFLIKLHNQNNMRELSNKEIVLLKNISSSESNSVLSKFPKFED